MTCQHPPGLAIGRQHVSLELEAQGALGRIDEIADAEPELDDRIEQPPLGLLQRRPAVRGFSGSDQVRDSPGYGCSSGSGPPQARPRPASCSRSGGGWRRRLLGRRAVMPLLIVGRGVEHLIARRHIAKLGIATDAAAVAELHFIGTVGTGIAAHEIRSSGLFVGPSSTCELTDIRVDRFAPSRNLRGRLPTRRCGFGSRPSRPVLIGV